MIGEIFKNSNRTVSGITWDKMVEKADLQDDEFILVYYDSQYRKFDKHKLYKHYEDEALKEFRGGE